MNYPIGPSAQQFIFACRRTASRLSLSDQEVSALNVRLNRMESADIKDPVMNIVSITFDTPIWRRTANAQSA